MVLGGWVLRLDCVLVVVLEVSVWFMGSWEDSPVVGLVLASW